MDQRKIYISTTVSDAQETAKRYGLGIEIAEYCTAWNMDEKFDEIHPKVQEEIAGISRCILHAPFNELFPCAIDKKARALAAYRYRQANERHLYCGSTDLSLSDAGKAEQQQLHYDIKNVRFLTSGMKRTNETQRILFGDVPYEEDPRFREVDFGIFEMGSYEELKDTTEYQTWLAGDNESNVPPSGESGVQMRKRVLEALADIREDTCIITHWQPAPGMGYAVNGCCYNKLPVDP